MAMMGSYPGHTLNVQPKSRLKSASVRVLPWVAEGHRLRFVGRLPSKHSGGGGENAEARGRMERKNGSFILLLVVADNGLADSKVFCLEKMKFS